MGGNGLNKEHINISYKLGSTYYESFDILCLTHYIPAILHEIAEHLPDFIINSLYIRKSNLHALSSNEMMHDIGRKAFKWFNLCELMGSFS